MKDKICLVTGANSGLGKVTAKALAANGATVIMACRNRDKGQAARADIVSETRNEKVDLMIADLSELKQIRRLAAEVRAKYPHLHVLVNNAGAYNHNRKLTADGYEMTFAVNHLGYFLLTIELLDLLKRSAPARVINVSSEAHRGTRVNFDDLNLENGYSGWRAYAQSKLANVIFTYELARRLEGTGVTANCMHPGTVGTNIFNNVEGLARMIIRPLTLFMRSPEKGADTIIWLATSPEIEGVTGKYFIDRSERKSNPQASDREVMARLWEVSERMCGLK
jgi:NAD(P)-dependent dehydrogenase (short-subunit alcohol dehydrogenase family)